MSSISAKTAAIPLATSGRRNSRMPGVSISQPPSSTGTISRFVVVWLGIGGANAFCGVLSSGQPVHQRGLADTRGPHQRDGPPRSGPSAQGRACVRVQRIDGQHRQPARQARGLPQVAVRVIGQIGLGQQQYGLQPASAARARYRSSRDRLKSALQLEVTMNRVSTLAAINCRPVTPPAASRANSELRSRRRTNWPSSASQSPTAKSPVAPTVSDKGSVVVSRFQPLDR